MKIYGIKDYIEGELLVEDLRIRDQKQRLPMTVSSSQPYSEPLIIDVLGRDMGEAFIENYEMIWRDGVPFIRTLIEEGIALGVVSEKTLAGIGNEKIKIYSSLDLERLVREGLGRVWKKECMIRALKFCLANNVQTTIFDEYEKGMSEMELKEWIFKTLTLV